jgi:hypothetical protein
MAVHVSVRRSAQYVMLYNSNSLRERSLLGQATYPEILKINFNTILA